MIKDTNYINISQVNDKWIVRGQIDNVKLWDLPFDNEVEALEYARTALANLTI